MVVHKLILITTNPKALRCMTMHLLFYTTSQIEECSAKRGLSPIWFISRKMVKQDFVYHCWQWLAVTLKWLLHMLWISHHYETFTECRNKDSVAEIDTNSIFIFLGLNPLLALYSSIVVQTSDDSFITMLMIYCTRVPRCILFIPESQCTLQNLENI